MRVKMLFISFMLFIICGNVNGQLKNELIDHILKSRSDYIKDSIPDVFKRYYNRFTQVGDKSVFGVTNFYDTLKAVILKTSFPKENFLWFEYMSDDCGRNYAILWTDSFMVHFNRRYIAQWDREISTDDSVIYKFEIRNNLKNSLTQPFLRDFEEWNEFVTNRSYLYWDGTGGGFIFCSKIAFKSCRVEIAHTAFRGYEKKTPLFYLREQSEDDYKPRLQVNCNWITEERLKEVVMFLIGIEKEKGNKVFDCDGKEMVFKQL